MGYFAPLAPERVKASETLFWSCFASSFASGTLQLASGTLQLASGTLQLASPPASSPASSPAVAQQQPSQRQGHSYRGHYAVTTRSLRGHYAGISRATGSKLLARNTLEVVSNPT